MTKSVETKTAPTQPPAWHFPPPPCMDIAGQRIVLHLSRSAALPAATADVVPELAAAVVKFQASDAVKKFRRLLAELDVAEIALAEAAAELAEAEADVMPATIDGRLDEAQARLDDA